MSNGTYTPELSIIVPTYNVDPYLNVCLDSIAAQSFRDWEAILVDDGSTDFSGIICDSYSRKDSRFYVIHQKNAGVSAARNAGIDVATAPLLAFIDPDDFVSTNYFELLIKEMYAINASVAVSHFRLIQEDGEEGRFIEVNQFMRYLEEKFPCKMMDNGTVVDAVCKDVFGCGCWGKVFWRGLWGTTRFPVDIDLGEDEAVVPGVIVRAKSAVCVPDAVYFYRQRKKAFYMEQFRQSDLEKIFKPRKLCCKASPNMHQNGQRAFLF